MSQKPCEDRSKDYEIGLVAFFRANAYYVESNYVYAQGAYIRSSSRFKTWSFLKAEFRPRNRNAKSEPRLSGLTLCVANLCPDCGRKFWLTVDCNMVPENGTANSNVCGHRTKTSV